MTSHAQTPRPDAHRDLKADLRANFLTRRAALSNTETGACAAVTEKLNQLLTDRSDGVVAGYMAMRGELDLSPALTALHTRGQRLCLPVTEAKPSPLTFRRWQPDQPLVVGAYGTLCPAETSETVLPDIVLVPLLAFDRTGHRLGFGKGYYDRTLEHLRATKKIAAYGIAYAGQEAASLPADPHDQRLDAVVTPAEIIIPAPQ